MFITAFFFPNTPPIVAPIRAAAQTDCRDLYNTQVIFKTPHPKKFRFTTFSLTEGRRWSKIFLTSKKNLVGGYTHTQSCGGVLVEQVIPKAAGVLVACPAELSLIGG